MEQRKIEHITLHLIVFGTIAIIGVLARQTVVLHYGWDEFSSYLILVVCSIIMGAIYLNLQMVFRQLLSPTIERCFMRFESYRNEAVAVDPSIVHQELIESTIDTEPIVSESEIENVTPSDMTEEVSIPSLPESNEDVEELLKEETMPSTNNNTSNQPSEYEILRANAMAEKERTSQEKNSIRLSHTQNKLWFPILMKRHLTACADM